MNDIVLETIDEINKIQIEWREQYNDLLVWTITYNTSDYPNKFTARPFSTRLNCKPLKFIIQDDCLDNLRERLPYGVIQLARDKSDSPVIVESWV